MSPAPGQCEDLSLGMIPSPPACGCCSVLLEAPAKVTGQHLELTSVAGVYRGWQVDY